MRVFGSCLVALAVSSLSCTPPCGEPTEPATPLLSIPLDGAPPAQLPPATVTAGEVADGAVQIDVDDPTYPEGIRWGVLDGDTPLLPAVGDVLTIELSTRDEGGEPVVAYARVLDASGDVLAEGGRVLRDGGAAYTGVDIGSLLRFQGVTDEVLCAEDDGRTRFRATAAADLDEGLVELTLGEPHAGAASGRAVQVLAHDAIHSACPDTGGEGATCLTSDLVIGGAYALAE